jgi:RNA polymerase sigma factor (sigma-70 family)
VLHAIARRAGEQDAEDVVQEAFLRIVETSRREEITKVDNLLKRIVRCVAIDKLRRRASRRTVATANAGEEVVDLATDPERSLMGAQRLTRVMAVIDDMPPKRREVFLLHRVEEMTYPQIARRLGVSVKAVEKHMALAMRQLSDADV